MPEERKKILYIEDDPEARYLMADIISYKGYQYFEASRGLEGIRLAKKHHPDLILIDLRLPDMAGHEVTTHLKSMDELQNTPIIALTADTLTNTRKLVLSAGCDGYITKPINVNEFLYRLEEYLAGKKDLLEAAEKELFLEKYTRELVQKLKQKISELETSNKNLSIINNELFTSREQMVRYNNYLFYLNNLANELRRLQDPYHLFQQLPAKITKGFQIRRVFIMHQEQPGEPFKLVSFSGFQKEQLQTIASEFTTAFLENIREDNGIMWIRSTDELVDEKTTGLMATIEAGSCIIADLYYLRLHAGKSSEHDSKQPDAFDSALEREEHHIIFLDKGKEEQPFATYEVRILKSFLQTVGIIYENMVLYEELLDLYQIKAEEAIRDGLTQLYNYRHFMRELERESNRTKRFQTPFSLIIIDIDFFKDFNDAHGHMAGDEILRQMARLIRDNTRNTDTVARYGGEEFTIILPGLKKKEGAFIAEKLQKFVEDHTFKISALKEPCRITISAGVAGFPEDSRDTERLLRLADRALYNAKHSGRNKVCIA